MAKILYGLPAKLLIKRNLIIQIGKLKRNPVLAIIQVGSRPDSGIYINQKKKFGAEVGVKVVHKKLSQKVGEKKLVSEIKRLNKDSKISGIIVQLPLPSGLKTQDILRQIDPKKDADGLSRELDLKGNTLITPATAKAVQTLLNFYKINVKGKKVAVVGRSMLAGAPIALILKRMGAKVTSCHKAMDPEKVKKICRRSEILITAAGQAGLVTKEFVNPNQVVIDVGINRVDDKVVGDVAFNEVSAIVKAISPVPGGIGPLTVASLFQNLLDLRKMTLSKK